MPVNAASTPESPFGSPFTAPTQATAHSFLRQLTAIEHALLRFAMLSNRVQRDSGMTGLLLECASGEAGLLTKTGFLYFSFPQFAKRRKGAAPRHKAT